MSRSMLNDKTITNDYWAEVVLVIIYTLNIYVAKAMMNITSYETCFFKKPNVKSLQGVCMYSICIN